MNGKAQSESQLQTLTGLAMAGAGVMIAHQVAVKAARDGFFLQNFSPGQLPAMVVAAALVSIAFAFGFARAAERIGPVRLVPASFAVSSLLHVAEWFALGVAPKPISILIYLHAVGLGATLLSGFWLLLSELFDLRQAKQRFGRIAGAGTAGGVLGGIAAERLAALAPMGTLLLFLAALHGVCVVVTWWLRRGHTAAPRRAGSGGAGSHAAGAGGLAAGAGAHAPLSIGGAFRRTPLLWQLAALVLLGTCTAALLDYLFKLGATAAMGKGPGLVRYFALYYTGCQILTFLLQSFAAKAVVERLGVSWAVASLPVSVGVGATAALLVPVYPLVAGVRAVEMILRGSLFRSGYEFLYTPVPPAEKRAVKTVVDVGVDRLGDAVGAGAVQLMVWLGPTLARPEILGLAMVLTAISTALAFRLDASYKGVLARGLVERAREQDEDEGAAAGQDSLLNTVFEGMPSMAALPRAMLVGTITPVAAGAGGAAGPSGAREETPLVGDAVLERLADLRSREEKRVRAALAESEAWEALLVPQAIRLLAWDAVSGAAVQYLERGGRRILGQLNDALSDQEVDFSVRRRLPRLLARVPVQQSVEGLLHGLEDPRFEIRYQCGRALEYLKRRAPELDFRTSAIYAAAERELSVSQAIWTSRRRQEGANADDYLDDVLKDRADRSLEHVFSLFAVVLPREPLMAAFRGLHQKDRMYRGLALEYLETLLPEGIRKRLWVVVEESPPEPDVPEETQKLLESLLQTNVETLRRQRMQRPLAEENRSEDER